MTKKLRKIYFMQLHAADSSIKFRKKTIMRKINTNNDNSINFKQVIENLENKYNLLSKESNDNSRRLKILNEIIIFGNKSTNLQSFLKSILDSILKLMHLDSGCIYLLSEKSNTFQIQYSKNLYPNFIETIRQIKIDENTFDSFLLNGVPIITSDFLKIAPKIAKECRISSLASIPLIENEKTIGVLNIVAKNKKYDFSAEDIKLLLDIGRESGMVISKIKFENALLQKTKYLEIASKVSEIISSTFNQDIVPGVIKDELDLFSCIIIRTYSKTKIGKITGIASDLEKQLIKRIKHFTFDLNNHEKIVELLLNVKESKVFLPSEILSFISSNFLFNKKITKNIIKTKIGEIIVNPLINSKNKRLGILLLCKKEGQSFNIDEKKLAQNLANKISSSIEIYTQAFFDDLTGLPNIKKLKNIFLNKIVDKNSFSLFVISINDFNKIIASGGDEIGDKCIIAISNPVRVNYC